MSHDVHAVCCPDVDLAKRGRTDGAAESSVAAAVQTVIQPLTALGPGRMLSEAKFAKFDMVMSNPRERTR